MIRTQKFIQKKVIMLIVYFISIQFLYQSKTTAQATPISPSSNTLPVKLPLEITQPESGKAPVAGTPTTPKPIKKVYEYKPICLDEVPNILKLSDALKMKRLNFLLKKLDEARADKKPISDIINKIVQEYLLQMNLIKADEFFKKENQNLSESYQVSIKAKIDIANKLFLTAKKELNNYLQTNPKDTMALELLIEANLNLKNYSEAYLTAEDLNKFNQRQDQSLLLCKISALEANHSKTEEICKSALKTNPTSPLPNIYIGISKRDQELYAEAISEFNKSLKKKETEFAFTCLAESHLLNKNNDEAILVFKKATELQPTSQRAWVGLAEAYVKKSLFKEALEAFKKTCDFSSEYKVQILKIGNELKVKKNLISDLYFSLGQNCFSQGKFK